MGLVIRWRGDGKCQGGPGGVRSHSGSQGGVRFEVSLMIYYTLQHPAQR
jgi:hypothetical protein